MCPAKAEACRACYVWQLSLSPTYLHLRSLSSRDSTSPGLPVSPPHLASQPQLAQSPQRPLMVSQVAGGTSLMTCFLARTSFPYQVSWHFCEGDSVGAATAPTPLGPSSHPSVHTPCAKKVVPQPGPGLPCPLGECPEAAVTEDHTGQLSQLWSQKVSGWTR